MRITNNINCINSIKENIFNYLTPLQKKVTVVAIGILSVFTLCYLYYYFKAKKETDEHLPDSPKESKHSISPIISPIVKTNSKPTPLPISHSQLSPESSFPILKQTRISTPMGTLIDGTESRQGFFETAQVTFKNGLIVHDCKSIKKLENESEIEGVFDSQLNGFGNIQRKEEGFLVLNTGEFLEGKLYGQGRRDFLYQEKKPKLDEIIYMEGEFKEGNFQCGKLGLKTGAILKLVVGEKEPLLQLAYGAQIKCTMKDLSCTNDKYYSINGEMYQKVQGFFDENLNGIGALATVWSESIGEFRNGKLHGWGCFKGIGQEDFQEGYFEDGKFIHI